MKILFLANTFSNIGASIVWVRLAESLCKQGHTVQCCCINKSLENPIVKSCRRSLFSLFYTIARIKRRILFSFFRTTNNIPHSLNLTSLVDVNAINNSDFDVVHIHSISNDTLSIADIAKIRKPIVCTLRDFYFFCGAEHYPNILENDTRYIDGYTKQNKPKSTHGLDLCRWTWLRKKKAWKNCKFHFIALSHWSAKELPKSALFRGQKAEIIPNIVLKDIFKPMDKNVLRIKYGIPKDKKVIGFGANSDFKHKNNIKGGYYLLEALKLLQNVENYHLVIFGQAAQEFLEQIPIAFTVVGKKMNNELVEIYNLFDVFITPSLMETFGNTCYESLACGVPVVAWAGTALAEGVEHKKNGYLAKFLDSHDLAQGIGDCIEHTEEYSKNALVKVSKFDENWIVEKHIELYKQVKKESTNENSL